MSSKTPLLVVAALLVCTSAAAQASTPLVWSQPAIAATIQASPQPIYAGWNLPSNDWFGITMVDDFACTDSRPIAGITFWGSYATAGSDGCLPRPAQPTFSFSIFAGSPAGTPVWTYTTDLFSQELVGVVADLRAISVGSGSVVRYTVTLPEENWFTRPCGVETYWLSIKTTLGAGAPTWWGWLTRPHAWGSQAQTATVSAYWWQNVPASYLRGSDMAFELLTVPEPAGLAALGAALSVIPLGLRRSRRQDP